jgi:hypothetical protein
MRPGTAQAGFRRVWLVIVALFLLAVGVGGTSAAGVCGNGVVEGGEECDPGGGLFCNGDPSASPCTTGAQCPGSTNCFFAFGCCKFNCQFVGQGADCFDGNDCTTGDHCDNVGRCVGQFRADGSACDDGLFCNGPDTCQTGDCNGHAGDPCTASTDCLATCDENADACVSTPFVPCGDDGNSCTDDVCDGAGSCTHPALPPGTVCRPAATVCDVEEVCAGGGAPCPADVLVPDDTPCGDLCTTNGSCQAGACVNGIPLVCDDGDACNGLETCDPLSGCQPGMPLDCDDGLPCTADTCDAMAGCGHAVLPDGAPCDDGQVCSVIDACVGGVCQGTTPNFLVRTNANLGSVTSVAGSLAVNEPDGIAKLSRRAFMTDGSLLTADTVSLGSAVSVFDLAANTVRGAGLVRGTLQPATLPAVPTWCTMPSSACGGANVAVGELQVVRIGPGSYGDVTVGGRGTLELDPGEYDFCSLKASAPTSAPTAIRPRGNVVVRIQGDFRTGRNALIEPLAGSLQIWVAGRAKLGAGNEVHRTVVRVPDSRLSFGPVTTFDGALCAQRLKTSRNATLGCPLP